MTETNSYFDLQVNGYAGVDFNQDDLTGDQLHHACERLAADGVEGILATIITEHVDVMSRRLTALADLRDKDPLAKRLIAGVHIEGPFINPADGFRGAHPADAVKAANVDDMQRLLDAAGGLARIVTLAPEQDAGLQVTSLLAKQGIVVSAGHTDATLEQLRAGIDAGLGMFTHLGNGCPKMLPRHDNIIQRALHFADRLWLTFIADGAHIPFSRLRNYLDCAGLERCIVVTDAIAAAGLPPGPSRLGRWNLQIGQDLVARSPDGSHLVGSAAPMARVEANLKTHLGLSDAECRTVLDQNPRRAVSAD